MKAERSEAEDLRRMHRHHHLSQYHHHYSRPSPPPLPQAQINLHSGQPSVTVTTAAVGDKHPSSHVHHFLSLHPPPQGSAFGVIVSFILALILRLNHTLLPSSSPSISHSYPHPFLSSSPPFLLYPHPPPPSFPSFPQGSPSFDLCAGMAAATSAHESKIPLAPRLGWGEDEVCMALSINLTFTLTITLTPIHALTPTFALPPTPSPHPFPLFHSCASLSLHPLDYHIDLHSILL